MSIYFIRVGGYFKVGASDDPQSRCDSLHRSSTRYTFPPGVSLDAADRELYRVVPGWKDDEAQVHLALDDFSVGLEWFLDEPELRAFVDSLPTDRPLPHPLLRVTRPDGWCEQEYLTVQQGRADVGVARSLAGRERAASP